MGEWLEVGGEQTGWGAACASCRPGKPWDPSQRDGESLEGFSRGVTCQNCICDFPGGVSGKQMVGSRGWAGELRGGHTALQASDEGADTPSVAEGVLSSCALRVF